MAEWRAEQQNYHIKPVSLRYLRERTFQKLILVGEKTSIMKIKVLKPSLTTTVSTEIMDFFSDSGYV